MRHKRWIAGPLLGLLLALDASAATLEARGLEIATESKARDAGFGDYAVTLQMTLRNAAGKESLRELRMRNLEVPGDGDKTLALFDTPKDVKGTALLTWAHRGSDDDRWLFLPAIKRVKRINSNNQSGPFMGSEFAYEDIGSFEVEKYTYRFVEEGVVDNEKTFVFERYPVHQDSGYSRQIVTLDQTAYRLLGIEYFDRKNSLLKTLTASGYQQFSGKYWKPGRYVMANHQTGKSTTLDFKDYRFGTGLKPDDFEPKRLESVQ